MPNLSLKVFNYLKVKEHVTYVAKTLCYNRKGYGYYCEDSPTVGIGCKRKDLVENKRYSDAEIKKFFLEADRYVKSLVMKVWKPGMSQGMFDALYLMTYGAGHVPANIARVVKSNPTRALLEAVWLNSKVTASAHVQRRRDEVAFFFSQDQGPLMDLNNFDLLMDGKAGDVDTTGVGSGGGMMYNGMLSPLITFNFSGPTVTTEAPTVLAKSNSNIYSRITASDKKNNVKHTRIYKYSEPTVKLDELSLPLTGLNTRIDPSTKLHVKENEKKKEDYSTKDSKKTEVKAATKKTDTIKKGSKKHRKYGTDDDNTTIPESEDTIVTTTDVQPTVTSDSNSNITPNIEGVLDTTKSESSGSNTETKSASTSAVTEGGYDIEMEDSKNPRGYRYADFKKAAGQSFPIIRINDYYVASSEIVTFEIETIGFIPIVRLTIKTANSNLLKNETIKEGDKMSIFCSPGHGMIKSLRCDFLITQLHHNDIAYNAVNQPYTFDITGELYVPSLYNSNMSFAFSGTSRDAVIDAASKLGLGFFFCDEENTDDTLMWYCTTEGGEAALMMQNTPLSNLMNYIQFVTLHAWKNFNSFFDSWIDPRYGVSFINMNKMLGESGMDETFDVTIFNSMLNSTKGVDGANIDNVESTKKNNPSPLLKLINNIHTDSEAGTAYYAESFKEINQAASISREIGVSTSIDYTVDNLVTDPSSNQVQVKFSIPYNKDKYPNGGFYIMIGPGENESYNLANNGSYVDLSTKVYGGVTTDMQADTDASTIAETGTNEMASGNVNKFFDVAYEHNRINNLQLQKKLVKVVLSGANFTIMRGEKIPVLLLDNNKMTSLLGTEKIDPTTNQPAESPKLRLARILNSCVYTNLSGWFIITGIVWRYNSLVTNGMTAWTTELTLTRREWPRPGYINVTNKENNILDVNMSLGTKVESKVDKSKDTSTNTSTLSEELKPTTEAISDADKVLGNVPLTGVKTYLKDFYHLLELQVGKNGVRLVGARRYASDTDGNRVEGNAFVIQNGKYKCIDALGNPMYFESNNSRHLYGEAIDIINGSGVTFEDLLKKYLLINGDLLKIMYDNGLSCYIETSIDDTGTTSRHYHIGTDTIKQGSWWAAVLALNGGSNIMVTSTNKFNLSNYMINNNKAEAEKKLYEDIEVKNDVTDPA